VAFPAASAPQAPTSLPAQDVAAIAAAAAAALQQQQATAGLQQQLAAQAAQAEALAGIKAEIIFNNAAPRTRNILTKRSTQQVGQPIHTPMLWSNHLVC
jgi:hypothetical protein